MATPGEGFATGGVPAKVTAACSGSDIATDLGEGSSAPTAGAAAVVEAEAKVDVTESMEPQPHHVEVGAVPRVAEPEEFTATQHTYEHAAQSGEASSEGLHPDEDSSSYGTPSSFSVDTDDDADSAIGSITQNSSMSATSSIYQFVEEFGRTFHRYKEGTLQVLDWKLFLAPIDRPNRVLDLGTGTGIWAIEFADQNPECDILGTDLSPIQPEYVPANCRFEIDDAEDEWIYSNKFDYIHGRYMCAFLSDFPKLWRNIYDNLQPGGWVEFMETLIYFQSQDGSLEGTALQRWNKLIIEGVKNLGRNVLSCMKYKKWMLETGFVNVEERKFVVPANPWAKGRKNKELGALQMVNNLNGVYGLTMSVLTKGMGWATEEVEVLLADVRKDMSDKDIHAYITIMVVYGQKPY
ncbi:methyltransferase domain-containing protein [Seiridium cupressi]